MARTPRVCGKQALPHWNCGSVAVCPLARVESLETTATEDSCGFNETLFECARESFNSS